MPRNSVRSSDRAREESSRQSSGRPGGAGARRTGRPVTSSASSARETSSGPATCSGPVTSERCELEQRMGKISHLHGRAQLVLEERRILVMCPDLVLRRLVPRPAHDE